MRASRRGGGGRSGGGGPRSRTALVGAAPRVRTRLAAGRQSSIGPMTDSHPDGAGAPPPERARREAARLLRNVVDALPEGALVRQLAGERPLRVKLGIDPTAPDIHLGHTVVLRKLREFQDLGHTVVLIIGDYTARVGDPSGRSATRPVLSGEEIDRNAETFQRQAFTVLDRERTEVRFNGEWLDMPMEELFRLARTSTVAQLLERDDFAKRYGEGAPISILELLYPLLQGYDSVAVRADVELGGTDQKFNLLLAREIQRAYGLEPQSVVTVPILPGIDGVQRMSKSLGNYVGVTDAPEEMFGKLMRVPDAAMPEYYALLVDEPFDAGRHPVESKRALARAIVGRFHGAGAAAAAEARFDRLHVERALPDEIEEAELPAGDAVSVPALVSELFGISRGEARRLIAQRGVRVDGEPLSDGDLDVPADRLDGAVLQVGKRRFRRLRRTSS
jgi:tyrosyl-tRNA synthetase